MKRLRFEINHFLNILEERRFYSDQIGQASHFVPLP